MQSVAIILALLLLIPAAAAGITASLLELAAHLPHLQVAWQHTIALATELGPLAPTLAVLMISTCALAAVLILAAGVPKR